MFRNYRELYEAYVEFYGTTLFGGQFWSGVTDEPLIATDGCRNVKDALLMSSQSNVCCSSSDRSKEKSPLISELRQTEILQGAQFESCSYSASNEIVSETQSDALCKTSEHGTDNSYPRIIEDGLYNKLNYQDLICVSLVCLALFVAKFSLNKSLKRSRLIESLSLRMIDRQRLDECVWRLLFYIFSSTLLVYSCFLKRDTMFLFSAQKRSFANYYTVDIHLDQYLICIIETAFYLHASYALVFEDIWRRDSLMMLLHHLAAIYSIISAYTTRTHLIGLSVLVLRDTCDVLLEVTKLARCLSIQNGKKIKSFDTIVNTLLAIFAAVFVVNQLYFYPLYCIYHYLNMIKLYKLTSPTLIGLATCGLIFLLLDLAWLTLILRLIYRMLFTNDPITDLREYDVTDGEEEACKNEGEIDKFITANSLAQ